MSYVGKNPNFNTTILDNQGAGGVPNAPTGKSKLINRNGIISSIDDSGVETTLATDADSVTDALPHTSEGDIMYRDGAGDLVRLPAGSDTEVLTLSSGVPTWQAPSGGGGVDFPLGSVLPVMNSLTGSYSIPGSGVVDANGWMRADGAAIPGGNTVTGTTPDLSNDSFIKGVTASTGSGGTGGGTANLTTVNIPGHTHTFTSSGPNTNISGSSAPTTGGPSNNTTSSSGTHSHTIGSRREPPAWGGPANFSADMINHSVGNTQNTTTSSAGSHTHSMQNHTHTVSSHTHTLSNHYHTGITDSTGSGTAFDIVPKYVNAVYLIKVN